jgi:hypothetical protein
MKSVEKYSNVIKVHLKWNVTIIKITRCSNDYKKIDEIIEDNYKNYKIKACIFVGEDTSTALSGDTDGMEKPSLVPWFTTGGVKAYEITKEGIVSKPYKMDICISLIYPISELDYNKKQHQIITIFEKFSNRTNEKINKINVFESREINTNSKSIYKNISLVKKLNYIENPTRFDIFNSSKHYYSMYYIHGHSNPSGTILNSEQVTWFSADDIELIKTPIFGVDGCYASGWWSNNEDNNILDQSILGTYYGSKIFSNEHIKVMILGLLSQNGYSYNVDFINNVIPKLMKGDTLAGSMIGSYYTGDFIIIGDPTFCFTI